MNKKGVSPILIIILVLIIIFMIVGIGYFVVKSFKAEKEPTTSRICLQDVRDCGNGTFVKRDPDNFCEFRHCPINGTNT